MIPSTCSAYTQKQVYSKQEDEHGVVHCVQGQRRTLSKNVFKNLSLSIIMSHCHKHKSIHRLIQIDSKSKNIVIGPLYLTTKKLKPSPRLNLTDTDPRSSSHLMNCQWFRGEIRKVLFISHSLIFLFLYIFRTNSYKNIGSPKSFFFWTVDAIHFDLTITNMRISLRISYIKASFLFIFYGNCASHPAGLFVVTNLTVCPSRVPLPTYKPFEEDVLSIPLHSPSSNSDFPTLDLTFRYLIGIEPDS